MGKNQTCKLIVGSGLFFILLLNFPGSKSIGESIAISYAYNSVNKVSSDTLFESYLQCMYDSCDLKNKGLRYEVFKKGMIGFFNLKKNNLLSNKPLLSIIDFDKSSKEERLWVIDLKKRKLLFHSLVAHGKNTGGDSALNFSNLAGSNMSSLGFFITKNTYLGKHGLSLVIQGTDKGFNDNAESRAVVIHGADYVSKDFIKCNNRLGRSHGCPALPVETHKDIINTLEGGSALFIYSSGKNYYSIYLDEKKAKEVFVKENNT